MRLGKEVRKILTYSLANINLSQHNYDGIISNESISILFWSPDKDDPPLTTVQICRNRGRRESPQQHWLRPQDWKCAPRGSKTKEISVKNIGVKVLITKWIIWNLGRSKTKEIYGTKKTKIHFVGWQDKRVDNNKTNKALASRFCSPQRLDKIYLGTITKASILLQLPFCTTPEPIKFFHPPPPTFQGQEDSKTRMRPEGSTHLRSLGNERTNEKKNHEITEFIKLRN